MADKEIITTADLEDQIQTTKKYLTMNRKTWTKTYSNLSILTVPSSNAPYIPALHKEFSLLIY